MPRFEPHPDRRAERPFLGLEAGRLAPGSPADFALIDPTLSWTVEDDVLRSRAKNSPFEHRTLEGRCVETVVAGASIYAYPRKG